MMHLYEIADRHQTGATKMKNRATRRIARLIFYVGLA